MRRSDFRSRIAAASDYAMIRKLCVRAVGPEDYVLGILKDVIERGRLFLVFSKGNELIGMSNFTPVFDKSGWLGMARTDPEWRGLGVAQFLQKKSASFARERGIRKLRFFVVSTNSASLRAAVKGGFKVVAEATHVSFKTNKISQSTVNTEIKEDEENGSGILDYDSTSDSTYLRRMNGYIGYGYAFVKGNKRNLAQIRKRGEMHSFPDGTFVFTQPEARRGEFSIITGTTTESLTKILHISKGLKVSSVGGFIPYDRGIINSAEKIGFHPDTWGRHLIVFEKKI